MIRKSQSQIPSVPAEANLLGTAHLSSAWHLDERTAVGVEDEQIDFALSANSPFIMKSGKGYHASQDSNNSLRGTLYNFRCNSMQPYVMAEINRSLCVKQGANSMRNVLAPANVVQTTNDPYLLAQSPPIYRQENTDSEFWNLTADDESQIDPVLILRNLNVTKINSGTTSSMIQIQEANNFTGSQAMNTQRQSLTNSYYNNRIENETKVPERAYQLLDIDQLSRENGQAILTEEPI